MEKYLVNPVTGMVDSESNWLKEMQTWKTTPGGITPEEQYNMLIEVRRDNDGEWVKMNKNEID